MASNNIPEKTVHENVGNSKIYFTILIYFHTKLLPCDAWQHTYVLHTCLFTSLEKNIEIPMNTEN